MEKYLNILGLQKLINLIKTKINNLEDKIEEIKYIEGVSDDNAYITNLTLPDAPEGYENHILSLLYFDPNINAWASCVSYKAVENSLHLITGGPSYGVAVVVGGVDCYRCANAKWRCYYIQKKL